MASGVVQVPVQFTDANNSMKALIAEFEKKLSMVKPGTAAYRSIESQLKAAQKLVQKNESKIDLGQVDKRGLDSMVQSFDALQGILTRVQSGFNELGDTDFNITEQNFGELGRKLLDINQELALTQKKLSDLKKSKVSDILPGNLDVQKYKNLTTDTASKKIASDLADAASRLDEATEAANKYKEALSQLQNIQVNEQNLALGKITDTAGSNKDGTASAQDYRQRLLDYMKSTYVGENKKGNQAFKSTSAKNSAQQLLTQMGMDEATISELLKGNLEKAWANLESELSSGNFGSIFKKSIFENARTLNQEGIDTAATDNAAKAQIPEIESQIADSENKIKQYQEQIAQLTQAAETLQQRLDALGASSYSERVDQLGEEVAALRAQIGNEGRAAVQAENVPGTELLHQAAEHGKTQIDTNKEAEDFQKQLKTSLTHWMGASQIISTIKSGIRQAYQDIKSLDTTMANMAVVTDLSVSDLWGRIDEYMSVAQQYGVTTQGVYEVMQLYAQQGNA